MGGGFLDVAQRHPGVQRCGDERVPQCVGPYLLGNSGPAGNPADDPPGAVLVQPLPVSRGEDRAFAPFAGVKVDRPGGPRASGMTARLPPLRVIARARCPRSVPERLDVRSGGFRDPQPVQGEQRDQGMLGFGAKACGDEEGADLVAVQPGRCES